MAAIPRSMIARSPASSNIAFISVSTTQHPTLTRAAGRPFARLADIVRRMLKKGLLQRRRTKEDARAYAVKLTDEGWRVLKSAEPLSRKVDDRILSALSAGQRDKFLQDLNSIVLVLGRMQPKDAPSKR